MIDVCNLGASPAASAAENSTAISRAFAAIDTPAGGSIVFGQSGVYHVNPLTLPGTPETGLHSNIRIAGEGTVTLFSTSAAPIFTNAKPMDWASSLALTGRRYSFDNLIFRGTSTAGQVGVRLWATGGPWFTRCTFSDLEDGVDLVFCPVSYFAGCFGKMNLRHTFSVRSAIGELPGADGSNSASNRPYFVGCRDYAAAGQTAQWYLKDVDGYVLMDCVAEGGNPVDSIHIDMTGNTSARSGVIDTLHVENQPTNATVRVKTNTKFALRNTWTASTAVPLVDASGSGSSAVMSLVDCEFAKLKHGGSAAKWLLHGPGLGATSDPAANPQMWIDGAAPASVYQNGFAGSAARVKSANLSLVAKDDLRLQSARPATGFVGVHLEAPTEIRAPATATVPGLMQAGYVSPSLNEVAGTLRFTVVESTGAGFIAELSYRPVVSSLPPPSAALRGQIRILSGTGGDVPYVCALASDGIALEWRPLAMGAP